MNIFLFLGGITGFLSVALGAFGAHALEGQINENLLSTWQTAVRYLMFHTAALLAVGILKIRYPGLSILSWAGWLFVIGIILFSGSLFILSVTGAGGLGFITPVGGVTFMIAWILLAIGALKMKNQY